MRTALVVTVLNEYGSIPGWIEGLRGQSRLPDECVIVDGGSIDGTLEALASAAQGLPFPTHVLSRPGTGISAGRNAAIAASTGDVVIVTDAGTVADPDWLERLVEPLERDADVDVCAGFFSATADTVWGRALAATTLPAPEEVNAESFLPSSRSVAFRRRWFDGGFQYPEWLDYCEDVVLDLQLRRAGARQVFVPEAIVKFQPRRGPISFFRQYFRYARGDGRAGLFARRHAVRYTTYAIAAIVLARRRPLELLASAALGAIYVRRPLQRYARWFGGGRRLHRRWIGLLGLVVAQRFLGDIAKMAGHPAGLVWRARRDRSLRFWTSGWSRRDEAGDLRRF